MAFLRIVRYGHPVDRELFVDLGPSVGRTSHTRLMGGNRSIIAGELVSGASGDAVQQRHAEMKRIRLEAKREYERRYYAEHKDAALERQRRYRERMG